MRPDRPALQSAVGTTVSTVEVLVTWLFDAVLATYRFLRRALDRLGSGLRTLWRRGTQWASELLSGPVQRFVTGPLRVVLLGRRTGLSLLAVLASPALALATAWWVGSESGYAALVSSVRGTWFGTDPSLAVFGAVTALLLLAAGSAAVNSGLLPTTLLVSGPVFGAAVTRYGTTVTYTWGTEVVSLPNAVGMATLLALVIGVPIAVAGFLLGSSARCAARTLRSQADVAAEQG